MTTVTATTSIPKVGRPRTNPDAPVRVRKKPPTFAAVPSSERDRIFCLAASVRNKLTVDPRTGCWVHPVGVLAQTAQPDGVRKSLGKYVWQTFHPEDAPLYTGPVGDPMTVSIQPRKNCSTGCINPDHLTKMTSAERSHRCRPLGLSPFMGVVFHKLSGTWQARFHADGQMFSGGYFPTDRQAAIRYDQISVYLDPKRPNNHSMGLLDVAPVPAPPNDRKLTSQHRGVFWNEPKQRWFARSSLGGVQRHIGSFKTEEEAALAYNQFVVDHGLDYPLNEV